MKKLIIGVAALATAGIGYGIGSLFGKKINSKTANAARSAKDKTVSTVSNAASAAKSTTGKVVRKVFRRKSESSPATINLGVIEL